MSDCVYERKVVVANQKRELMHCAAIERIIGHGLCVERGRLCEKCKADADAPCSGESVACRNMIGAARVIDCLRARDWAGLAYVLKDRPAEAQERALMNAIERGMTPARAQEIAELLGLKITE